MACIVMALYSYGPILLWPYIVIALYGYNPILLSPYIVIALYSYRPRYGKRLERAERHTQRRALLACGRRASISRAWPDGMARCVRAGVPTPQIFFPKRTTRSGRPARRRREHDVERPLAPLACGCCRAFADGKWVRWVRAAPGVTASVRGRKNNNKAYRVMAYIVIAYIVMAYVVMAYIHMAYIVMACIDMAYIVMAYIALAYIVMANIVMAYIVYRYIYT